MADYIGVMLGGHPPEKDSTPSFEMHNIASRKVGYASPCSPYYGGGYVEFYCTKCGRINPGFGRCTPPEKLFSERERGISKREQKLSKFVPDFPGDFYYWFPSGYEEKLVEKILLRAEGVKEELSRLRKDSTKSFAFQVGGVRVTGKPACENSLAKVFLYLEPGKRAAWLR